MFKKVFILIFISMFLCSCSLSEKQEYEKKAINYFSKKYGINKKDIKVRINSLENDKFCIGSCGLPQLRIIYNNKECIIYRYGEDFTDDYQLQEIQTELNNYINNKYTFVDKIIVNPVNGVVDCSPEKYNNDIKDYLKRSLQNDVCHFDMANNASVTIWKEVINETDAKEFNDKYYKQLILGLEDLSMNYTIHITKKIYGSDTDTYYKYFSNISENKFIIKNRIDNIYKECNRSSINFEGNKLLCE